MANTPITKQRRYQEVYDLIQGFIGYRAREDISILPAGTLIQGSQNVLSDTSGRWGIRKGYTLDGASDGGNAGFLGAYDFQTSKQGIKNIRTGELSQSATANISAVTANTISKTGGTWTAAGFTSTGEVWINGHMYTYTGGAGTTTLTGVSPTPAGETIGSIASQGNGKFQFRYDNGTSVSWITLLSDLTSTTVNFTNFYDTTQFINICLFAYGQSLIGEWNGAVATVASNTANTITLQGTATWAQLGFYSTTSPRAVTINGVSYTYTGGETTQTLTGLAALPAFTAGTVVAQTPIRTPLSAMTTIVSNFVVDTLGTLDNQLFVGDNHRSDFYVSVVNDYKTYTFSAPRAPGEGAHLVLDGNVVSFVAQEEEMYVSSAQDQWWKSYKQLSSDNTKEAFSMLRLNTLTSQGSRSQYLTNKVKNSVAFVSFETVVNTFGRVDNVVLTPQMTDLSYPIINDINAYDFTDGQIFFFQKFLYIAVPKNSIVLVYNLTNEKKPYWEAPQLLPVSRFYVVDGELYGHAYSTGESYKLFSGNNDAGSAINATALFCANHYGKRYGKKGYNKYYVEGYISGNTTLNLGIQYETGGCASNFSYPLSGSDTQFVCIGSQGDNNIGGQNIGGFPIGTNLATQSALPPKFRWIRTFPIKYFYEDYISFSSNVVDANWSIIAHGPTPISVTDLQTEITE